MLFVYQITISNEIILFLAVMYVVVSCILVYIFNIAAEVEVVEQQQQQEEDEQQEPENEEEANVNILQILDNINCYIFNENEQVDSDEIMKCSICLENYVTGEIISVLSCEHEFHKRCIEEWLNSHVDCPLCRQVIV